VLLPPLFILTFLLLKKSRMLLTKGKRGYRTFDPVIFTLKFKKRTEFAE